MAISYVGAGAAATGSTSLSIPYPSGLRPGDLLVVCIGNKRNVLPSTPAGWTLPSNGQGTNIGTGDGTVDQGYGKSTVFYRIAGGWESGNLTVTITNGNSAVGRMFAYRNATREWSVQAANGADNTAGTDWSCAMGQTLNLVSGDWVVACSGINTDGPTWSAQAISGMSGSPSITNTERQDSGTSTGLDCRLVVSDHSISGGTTGDYTMTFTMTASTSGTNNPCGSTVLFRLREAPQTKPYVWGPPNYAQDIGGYQFLARTVYLPSSLLASASRVQLAFARGAVDYAIGDVWIGHGEGTGDDWDFDGNQVRVTFDGGSTGKTVLAGQGYVLSDEIVFSVNTSKRLIVSIYFGGASGQNIPRFWLVQGQDTDFNFHYWDGEGYAPSVDDTDLGTPSSSTDVYGTVAVLGIFKVDRSMPPHRMPQRSIQHMLVR